MQAAARMARRATHLRPEKCFFRRTRRRKKRFDSLPPSADGGTLRGVPSQNRYQQITPHPNGWGVYLWPGTLPRAFFPPLSSRRKGRSRRTGAALLIKNRAPSESGQGAEKGAIYLHSSTMAWVKILQAHRSCSTLACSSGACILGSKPGKTQPKATPPGMSWT